MLRSLLILIISILATTTAPALADDSTGSVDRPNAVYGELLGRGLIYSFDYDRMLTDSFAIGAGFSSWTIGDTSSNGTGYAAATVVMVPIYVNWYFARAGGHSGFLTGGPDLINASFNFDGLNVSGSAFALTIGAGYEYRSGGGFLFRGSLYALIAGGSTNLWPGFSFGYAF